MVDYIYFDRQIEYNIRKKTINEQFFFESYTNYAIKHNIV